MSFLISFMSVGVIILSMVYSYGAVKKDKREAREKYRLQRSRHQLLDDIMNLSLSDIAREYKKLSVLKLRNGKYVIRVEFDKGQYAYVTFVKAGFSRLFFDNDISKSLVFETKDNAMYAVKVAEEILKEAYLPSEDDNNVIATFPNKINPKTRNINTKNNEVQLDDNNTSNVFKIKDSPEARELLESLKLAKENRDNDEINRVTRSLILRGLMDSTKISGDTESIEVRRSTEMR